MKKCFLKHIRNGIFEHVLLQFFQGRRKVGAWGALAPPMFGQTVNPISTRGADYARQSTTSPPKVSDLATALWWVWIQDTFWNIFYFIK